MSGVTFFGEVRDLTSRALDDDDDEDATLASLHVKILFTPNDVTLPAGQQLLVSVVDKLPASPAALLNVVAESGSGFSARLASLSPTQAWLAVRFEHPLRSDSWQTRVIADAVMRKLPASASQVTVLMLDPTSPRLQQISNQIAATAAGVEEARVPKMVGSAWEAAIFEWCTVIGVACRILLIPGPDCLPLTDVPDLVTSSLLGLKHSAVADSNIFT